MRYWISYDLGLRGNYDQLLRVVDKYNARECGIAWQHSYRRRPREQLAKELHRSSILIRTLESTS